MKMMANSESGSKNRKLKASRSTSVRFHIQYEYRPGSWRDVFKTISYANLAEATAFAKVAQWKWENEEPLRVVMRTIVDEVAAERPQE